MSSSLDSDVFLSNDEEYLNKLAKPVTRAQLNSNQSNNNDGDSGDDNNRGSGTGQNEVLRQLNLQANSEGGANPNSDEVVKTSYGDQEDVSIFIAELHDVKDDKTGIPQIIWQAS